MGTFVRVKSMLLLSQNIFDFVVVVVFRSVSVIVDFGMGAVKTNEKFERTYVKA